MTRNPAPLRGAIDIDHNEGQHAVLYVSTFPPRKCGIATYTQDLTRAMDEMLAPAVNSRILALNTNFVAGYHYPRKVVLQLNQDNEKDYARMARRINRMSEVRLVYIQHEFGIFGGERGSYLIPFLEALKKPAMINFHTVLPGPDDQLRGVVRSLAGNVKAVTVMTELSRRILVEDYEIPDGRIRVIPHGIHSRPFTTSRQAKTALGFSDRVVISTFGLLNRGKGLEYVIEALPEVVKRFPNFVYIYFGATHPVVLQEEGESYRNELIEKIHDLGLFDHVRFYNKFFPLSELLRFLKATDIYISTGLEPNQAVSGTLSYALGAGRPVISTAFANARELISDDVGLLVDFRDPEAYKEAILRLLEDEPRRLQMGRNAYFMTRRMIWPNVAVQYAHVFSEISRRLARISEKKSLPKVKLDHLVNLTDSFGVVQFARLTRPDAAFGYTLDDNARALVAAALHYSKLRSIFPGAAVRPKRDLLRLINTYLDFIRFVSGGAEGFQNYVKADRTLDVRRNSQVNLDDASARACYALAVTAATGSLPRGVRQKALDLLREAAGRQIAFKSPRAIALWVKALCVMAEKRVEAGFDVTEVLKVQSDTLVRLYENTASPDWQWFEDSMTYSNGILPEALLLSYRITGDERYLTVGRTTLDFLVRLSFAGGIYIPVGQNGWHQKEGRRNEYDQQPEEVKAMVYALKAGYIVTRDKQYRELMHRAFYWFLGDNTLKQVVYDRHTGGCYDGVGKKAVNLNQGAESTISYLLARLAFWPS